MDSYLRMGLEFPNLPKKEQLKEFDRRATTCSQQNTANTWRPKNGEIEEGKDQTR